MGTLGGMVEQETAGKEPAYRLVRLANGTHSIRAMAEGETFHPVIGPEAEAEALYVKQLDLRGRMAGRRGEFVIWDVGLGAAANTLTALRATRDLAGETRVISFDRTVEPLRFALAQAGELPFLRGYEAQAEALAAAGAVEFEDGARRVRWEWRPGDFPVLMREGRTAPGPDVIMFDAFSPAKNPAMWTAPLFRDLFRRLDAARPCAMPTYSRSTMLRVTLLLAGFHVGAGHATGEKEETTIAANDPALLREPLGRAWLERARRSRSAEPLWEAAYRQAPLRAETWEALRGHPQFRCCQL